MKNAVFRCIISLLAGVMELVDVVDSKSTAGDSVPVRVRSPAPARRKRHIACDELLHFIAKLIVRSFCCSSLPTAVRCAGLTVGFLIAILDIPFVNASHVGAKCALLDCDFVFIPRSLGFSAHGEPCSIYPFNGCNEFHLWQCRRCKFR